MKRLFLLLLTCLTFGLGGSLEQASAIPADPRPIRVTQPDGTTLEIRIHGDEYLSWRTHNNRLVSQGPDGYYYYAQFEADGSIIRTSTRVTSSGVSLQSFGNNSSPVVPPAAAIQKAMERRMDVRKGQQLMPPLNNPFTHGEFRFLCILVNFADVKFTISDPNTKFSNLLNQSGYSENGGTGSSYDYYYDNSNGAFAPTFDVYGPVELSRNTSYYGGNGMSGSDTNPWALSYDAVEAAIEQCGLDLTQYDNNNDGVLDNVFFFYAGYNEAEGGPEDSIWPHKSTGYGTFQGISVHTYACSSELRGNSGTNMAGIGTFTHEFGHVLGLPDFYDTDYASNGMGSGLGSYSLMSTGCYNNNLNTPPHLTYMERYMLSWAETPKELTESGTYQLKPVHENDGYWSPTATENEYFLYEYRTQESWDTYLPSEGILIYHVDQSKNEVHNGRTAEMKWKSGDINNYAEHQCLDLVEAVTEGRVTHENQIPFPGAANVTRFDASSTPGAIDWAGNPTNYNLTNISKDGSFVLNIYEGMTVQGTVSKEDRTKIAGATVSLRNLYKDNSTKTTTDSDGFYSLLAEQDLALLQVEHTGFHRHICWIDAEEREVTQNITLKEIPYLPSVFLSKNRSEAAQVVAGPATGYAGIRYTSTELQYYHDYAIAGIEFSMVPEMDSPSAVGVFIYDQTQQTMLVKETATSTSGSFETSIFMDLSQWDIVLDSAHDYIFGYWYENSKDELNLLTDQGPQMEGGCIVSTDGQNWNTMEEGNLLTKVYLSSPQQRSALPMILVEKELYDNGDSIQLKLRRCDIQPTSISWTYDGQAYQTGDWISLSNGSHTIIAVLTFPDGSTQTLIQEIGVL